MSIVVRLPTGYFPDPNQGRPVALGTVFIGIIDTDPEVLANRKTVTLLQEDNTQVVIPPASQPIELNAGGVFTYQGSPVQVLVEGNYSIKVLDSSGVQEYYFPNSNSFTGYDSNLLFTNGVSNALSATSTGLTAGQTAQTIHYDSDRTLNSGAIFQATGTTIIGNAGNCPDVDGYFYDADGRQFEVSGTVNLLAFGAKGDEVTDDTNAIISALASANTSTGNGRVVIVPDGIYRYSTISLNSYSEVSIIGLTTQVWDSTPKGAIFKGNTASTDGFVYNPASLTRCGIHLENLFFDGNNQTDTNVKFDNFRGVSVLRCVSVGCVVDGFDFGGDSINNTSLYVEQSYVNNPGASGYIVDCALAEFRENKCDGGIYSLDIGPNQGSGTYIGNNFEGATSALIRCQSSLNSFTDNRLAGPETTTTGFLFTGTLGRNNNVKGGNVSSDGGVGSIAIECETGLNTFDGVYMSDVETGIRTEAGQNSFNNINFGTNISGNAFEETAFGGVGNTITGGQLQSGTVSLSNAVTKIKGLIGYSDKFGIAGATLPSGNTNNYTLDQEVDTVFITANAANSTITGIGNGQQGRRLTIINRTTNNLIIAHDNVNSTEANRIRLPNSVDITLDDYEAIILNYDPNIGRWFASSFTQ